MVQSMLSLKDLVKRYDAVTAVDHLSFEVDQGEVFGLLGPNGAGKTTAIRVIMDIFTPDEGEVRVLGQSPGKIRSRVGYLPEERGLYRDLKVAEVLVRGPADQASSASTPAGSAFDPGSLPMG